MSGGSSQSTSSQAANYDQRQVNTTTYDMSSYDLSNRSTNTTNTTTNADFSDRSTTTNNSTTNADFSDRSTTNLWSDSSNRSVNTSNSNNTSTTNADFSNRSTTNTSTSIDNSDRSTTQLWNDSSNHSVNNTSTVINNTTLDGGAVSGALALAGSTVQAGVSQLAGVLGLASTVVAGQNASLATSYDYADHLFNHALDAVSSSEHDALDAFNKASVVQSNTIDQLQGAYADAKGTSDAQMKIMLGVLAVAALLVLKKG